MVTGLNRVMVCAPIFLVLVLFAVTARAQDRAQNMEPDLPLARRSTLAITYPDGGTVSFVFEGTAMNPLAGGRGLARRESGETRLSVELMNLDNPQTIGAFYTAYVLWAVSPDGKAENLSELEVKGKGKRAQAFAVTRLKTFGLVVTAEPYATVSTPGPLTIAENKLKRADAGPVPESVSIRYRIDSEPLLMLSTPDSSGRPPDYDTPLPVLGARYAVIIARRVGAGRNASGELIQAESRLSSLEQALAAMKREPDREKVSKAALAVMRLAEQARQLAVAGSTSPAGEADGGSRTVAIGQSETQLLNSERPRLVFARSESDSLNSQESLFKSISSLLPARRQAQDLAVILTEGLFDSGRPALNSDAREKLARLAGIIGASSRNIRLRISGTGSGTSGTARRLLEQRAESIRYFLIQSGLPSDVMVAGDGNGFVPVSSSPTGEGDYLEILISGTDVPMPDGR